MENLTNTPATELFRHFLDKFLTKDMKGLSELWADVCERLYRCYHRPKVTNHRLIYHYQKMC